MRVIVVGATGTIGNAIVTALTPRHDVVPVSHRHGQYTVDIAQPESIRAMYRAIGRVDAVISAAGQAAFKPLAQLTDADFQLSLSNKLMGQVNLVRFGLEYVADNGSITLTSGILAQHPAPGSAAVSLVNAGLEGFTRAAALEAPRGIRVNVVSPPWVAETLKAMGRDVSEGLPASVVARAYVRSLEGDETGAVIQPQAGG